MLLHIVSFSRYSNPGANIVISHVLDEIIKAQRDEVNFSYETCSN